MSQTLLADRVRAERDRLQLSQRQLAKQVGCAPSAICQLEAGTLQPRYSFLLKLAMVVDLTALLPAPEGTGAGSEPAEEASASLCPACPLHTAPLQTVRLPWVGGNAGMLGRVGMMVLWGLVA